ncbi:NADH:flavin oxidoreductase/NADH oxidase [Fomes fomentarius]|nr:NADH:flavin oxidoreductase/NADH oxidase [Fomes fomentarius]
MSASITPALFRSIKIGDITLSHRVVLAPQGRHRADTAHVPTDLMAKYYGQRASVPGTLLISEATLIIAQAGGIPHLPGLWSDAQVAGWQKASALQILLLGATDTVHKNGSYFFAQLWAMGRAARQALLKQEDPSFEQVGPSPIPLSTNPDDIPRELTKDEIKQYVQWYAKAASNAVHRAGFDGIEVHGANGYLVDQFLQSASNQRTDEYGGSIENRARFALEVVDAIVKEIGESKTAIRFSPWNTYQDMGKEDPIPAFSYLVKQLKERYPNLAYVHVASPNAPFCVGPKDESTAEFIYKIWAPRPVITTGGYTRETGLRKAEETGQLIGYGRDFLANPDLPFRLRESIPLNVPDPATFFTPEKVEGYTTYPFSEAFLTKHPSFKA